MTVKWSELQTLSCPWCTEPVREILFQADEVEVYTPLGGTMRAPAGKWRMRCPTCNGPFSEDFTAAMQETQFWQEAVRLAEAENQKR